jgi:ssDNA-binding replication factor A large subunit
MDQEIGEIYEQIKGQISPEEFEERVGEKFELMGELCDRRTAAMLVAREFGEVELKIDRIRPETGKVTFVGKVVAISDVHEFPRSSGGVGRVVNVTVSDETGSVRIVLWDELAEPVSTGEIHIDQTLRVRGFTREGYFGTEVTVDRGGLEEVEAEITTRTEPLKISEVRADMGDIHIRARVLDPGTFREFSRRDGSVGLVRSVILGDDSGKIRLTLWNEKAEIDLVEGDTLEVTNALTRESTARWRSRPRLLGREEERRFGRLPGEDHPYRSSPPDDLQRIRFVSASGGPGVRAGRRDIGGWRHLRLRRTGRVRVALRTTGPADRGPRPRNPDRDLRLHGEVGLERRGGAELRMEHQGYFRPARVKGLSREGP